MIIMYDTRPFYIYRAFGLTISSELELIELQPADPIYTKIDLDICLTNVPQKLENAQMPLNQQLSLNQWSANDHEFLLHVDDVASYLVSHGVKISVQLNDEAELPIVKSFLLGSCIAAILQQRSQMLLHASSFELNGSAYAICGKSGTGKSTTTAIMHKRGARLLSDDVTAISFDPMPTITPGYPQSKLSKKSLGAIEIEPGDMHIIKNQKNKYARPVKDMFCDKSTKLKAIFILDFHKDSYLKSQVNLYQIYNSEALMYLRKSIYRRQYILPNAFAMIFTDLGKVVSSVPIFKVERSKNLDSFDEVNKALISKISELCITDERVIDETKNFA